MIIRRYPNQRYTTFFNPENGFFVRKEDQGQKEPFWCHVGPELIDFSITNRCQRRCSFCYRHSSSLGCDVTIEDYLSVMEQARKLGTLQVALGGGNPNEHPDFIAILEATRKHQKIVPNYTTNGDGLSDDVIAASAEYCGAVAVSYYEPTDQFRVAVDILTSAKIKTNVHFLLSNKTISTASKWIASPPQFLSNINAIIFLTYKPHSTNQHDIKDYLIKQHELSQFLKMMNEIKQPFKIGFDSCLVPAILENTTYPQACYEFCESARFSMFVSEELYAYPCSFMTGIESGISLRQNTLSEAWQSSTLFLEFRNRISNEHCDGCKHSMHCSGGCPIFNLELCSLKLKMMVNSPTPCPRDSVIL